MNGLKKSAKNRGSQYYAQSAHYAHTGRVNSLTTRGPGPGPYIDHVLYEGPRAGALRFGENSVNCRHGNTFCSVH